MPDSPAWHGTFNKCHQGKILSWVNGKEHKKIPKSSDVIGGLVECTQG